VPGDGRAGRHFGDATSLREVMQGFLELFSDGGQLAVILAEMTLVGAVWLAMLWKPRHRTHRQPHDCRALGCPWLDERPH